jgi:ribonuclease HI
MVAQPHFLLFCDTHIADATPCDSPTSTYVSRNSGRWHFVLERLDGPERLEAADSEFSVNRERLALLSVVRGLEALEQPSQVTLVTTSRYVSRGLRYGLNTWREANYQWERFGEQKPIRNSDLWRRIDTALQFHGVKCRLIQPNPLDTLPAGQPVMTSTTVGSVLTPSGGNGSLPTHAAAREIVPLELKRQAGRVAGARRQASSGGLSDLRVGASACTRPAHNNLESSLVYDRKYTSLLALLTVSDWWTAAWSWLRGMRGRLQPRPAMGWPQTGGI